MAPEHLHILQHSLGVDQFGRGKQYRNHFVTGEGSDDWPHCMALVKAGLMVRQKGGELTGGDDAFFVTDAGKQAMAEHSPARPKESAGKRRYREWIEADCNLSFMEWLKRRRAA